MMSDTYTHSGFVLTCQGLYLLCHATQNKFGILTDHCWAISKGKIEEGETPFQAAVRELEEETGIVYGDLRGHECDELVHEAIIVNHSKNVAIFHMNLPNEYKSFKYICSSLIDNEKHPLFGYPEMDGYMFATKEIARGLVFNSQKVLFQ